MNIKLILFGIVILLNSCKIDKNIENTKWTYSFDECEDYLEFKTQNYLNYSCELDELFYGNYYVKKDTIILYQNSSEYDEEFDEDSRHRSKKLMFKLLIKGEGLIFIERWQLYNSIWKKSSFNFNDDYIFIPK